MILHNAFINCTQQSPQSGKNPTVVTFTVAAHYRTLMTSYVCLSFEKHSPSSQVRFKGLVLLYPPVRKRQYHHTQQSYPQMWIFCTSLGSARLLKPTRVESQWFISRHILVVCSRTFCNLPRSDLIWQCNSIDIDNFFLFCISVQNFPQHTNVRSATEGVEQNSCRLVVLVCKTDLVNDALQHNARLCLSQPVVKGTIQIQCQRRHVSSSVYSFPRLTFVKVCVNLTAVQCTMWQHTLEVEAVFVTNSELTSGLLTGRSNKVVWNTQLRLFDRSVCVCDVCVCLSVCALRVVRDSARHRLDGIPTGKWHFSIMLGESTLQKHNSLC